MNLFKQGNNYILNLDCLEVLSRMEKHSVDLIYLDPPWNLPNSGFIYHGDSNTDYEEFIYSVIQQSKRILKRDGNLVFYSIPSLNFNFHNLITPVFGSENFKAEFIIPKKRIPFRNKQFTHNHETVIFYSASKESKFFPLMERGKEELERLFPIEDGDRRYRLEPLVLPIERPNLDFNWNGFELPKNRFWRYSKERLDELEHNDKIFFEKDMRFPRLKRFSDETDEFNLQMVDSVWNDIKAYNLKEKTPAQSQQLLDRIIKLSTQEGDIVLDPFMGSGVSGISAIKNNRNWIGVEINGEIFNAVKQNLEKDKYKEIQSEKLINKPVIWNEYDSYKLSETELLLSRITKGENQRLEFKEAYHYDDHSESKIKSLPNKIMKEIAAFLNSSYGGSLLLGVRDNGEIRGLNKDVFALDENAKNPDKLELAITSKIKETFNGSSIDLINLSFVQIENKYVCEIEISQSDKPVFINKDFYVRNGTQADTLKAEELYDLMKKRRKI